MPRLSISDLPRPKPQFDPSQASQCERTGARFETPLQARAEDMERAALIRRACLSEKPPFDLPDALPLADRLEQSGRGEHEHETLASAVHMGGQRFRIGGALWEHHDTYGGNTFTVRPRGWEFSPSDLAVQDPELLKQRFRAALNRLRVGEPSGYLWACLHGEFNANTGRFEVHIHGVAEGAMLGLVDELRRLPQYRQRKADGHKSPRVVVGRKPLTNLPYPLTYTVQSYWPYRWRGVIDAVERRGKVRHRIPDPCHTQLLLWLDRWRLEDLTLMTGMSVGPDGFSVSPKRTPIG